MTAGFEIEDGAFDSEYAQALATGNESIVKKVGGAAIKWTAPKPPNFNNYYKRGTDDMIIYSEANLRHINAIRERAENQQLFLADEEEGYEGDPIQQ